MLHEQCSLHAQADTSYLSPVSIQNAMPASRSRLIVCGTNSCNLSSMADAPTSFRSFSMASQAISTAAWVCTRCNGCNPLSEKQ